MLPNYRDGWPAPSFVLAERCGLGRIRAPKRRGPGSRLPYRTPATPRAMGRAIPDGDVVPTVDERTGSAEPIRPSPRVEMSLIGSSFIRCSGKARGDTHAFQKATTSACASDAERDPNSLGTLRIEESLALVNRRGGHNVAGRAVADDAVMIDLAEMKGASVDPAARTVRAEGGLTWAELNDAVAEHGLAVTGRDLHDGDCRAHARRRAAARLARLGWASGWDVCRRLWLKPARDVLRWP